MFFIKERRNLADKRKARRYFYLFLFFSSLFMPATDVFSQAAPTFDIQGHRGARGLMPENTIPAFLKALDLGVDTLELDTVVSRDGKLVVSHEPFFSSEISLDKNGLPIPPEKQTEYNLSKMDYSEIRRFDVGSLGAPRFPEQRKIKTIKPLLADVFKETQKYSGTNRLKPVMEQTSHKFAESEFNHKPAVTANL